MRKLEKAPIYKGLIPNDYFKILSETDTKNLINKIHEEYYYWDKVKHMPVPKGVKIKDIWTIIKLRRMNTPYQIQFGKYKFYWNLNSRLHGLLHFLDLNIGGSLESSAIISKGEKNRYLISSVMEEAIASSQIEGAVTTRKHAKDMLRKNIKPRNTSEQMIANNFETIQKILDIKSEPLTKEKLLHVHRLVTTHTLNVRSEEGALRESDDINVIDTTDGSVVHAPPSKAELDELLADLFKFFNEDDPNLFIHPIVKACIIHFMIGFIHPFSDGNGRTSRALFYWYLLKKEYWLTEYLSISRLILRSKAMYARAFQYTEIDEGDLTYFVAYSLRIMKLAFEELRDYIRRKNEEKKHLSSFLGMDGINYRQALILDWFSQEPSLLLTVKETETRLGVSNASARTDLNELYKKGYLGMRDINKVMKGFIKGEGLDILMNKLRNKSRTTLRDIRQPSLFNS